MAARKSTMPTITLEALKESIHKWEDVARLDRRDGFPDMAKTWLSLLKSLLPKREKS